MCKRPMVIITVSYIIGIIMGLYFEINAALFVFANFVVLCVIFFLKFKYFNSNVKSDMYKIFIVIISIIVCIISFSTTKHMEKKYANIYLRDNEQVVIKGMIVDEKKPSNYYNKYVVKVSSINNDEKYKDINVILRIKKTTSDNLEKLKYGDIVRCTCVMEKPSTRKNYKGFDYAQSQKTQKIYMICKTEVNKVKVVSSKSQLAYKMWISNLRNKIMNNLSELLDTKTLNVANALFIGVSDYITDEQREVFNNASLIHILAISGMHVGYMIVFLKFILKKCDTRKSKYLYIIILLIFADLTGNSPSVERAVIMSSIMISSKLFYRKSDSVNNIAISCLILLIINPYYILNLGFQLSFLGTLGIIILYPKIMEIVEKHSLRSMKTNNTKHLNKVTKYEKTLIIDKVIQKVISTIKSVIIIGISANLLMFPAIIYSSNCFSLTFLVSTILITPILGIMIFTGYITIFISFFSMKLASLLAMVLKTFISIFNHIAQFSSNITILRFTVPTPSILVVICYYVSIFYLFFYYKPHHKKAVFKIFTCFLAACLIFRFITFQSAGMKLYFIDVGQGDSSLVITEESKTILIDGGRK